ncbi:DarT ssDNA thymidine ADP-ribosyltransferase family protein [Roseateles chitinivorans]|uniref:DarT ssDNA thymidine ADP-ribosyltransferase family protein n=1 Tax=Roseateles chitinivorans TaxID=2917965 RepID=UPI003D67F223
MATTEQMIQAIVAQRKIEDLVHFTRLANLPSILKYGLVPRETCRQVGIDFLHNDEHRIDGTDGISMSIGFPNYKMFYQLRVKNPTVDWVVIGINPEVLWEKSCLFCQQNAAHNDVTAIPQRLRKLPARLDAMYCDFGSKTRASLNLPDNYPTHPQAEVISLDLIEPKYFRGVGFKDAQLMSQVTPHPTIRFQHTPNFYFPRRDYPHWKREN